MERQRCSKKFHEPNRGQLARSAVQKEGAGLLPQEPPPCQPHAKSQFGTMEERERSSVTWTKGQKVICQ